MAAKEPLGPDVQPPVIVNDRGRSMKAKSLREFFGHLRALQLFALLRRPDDNPFTEAAFWTVKYHPQCPERFAEEPEAQEYFTWFLHWDNHNHRTQRSAMSRRR